MSDRDLYDTDRITADLADRPTWMADALCAQVGPGPFYLEKGDTPREARSICDACPAKALCLDYILSLEGDLPRQDRHGIWASTTPAQRALMSSERRATA